ncbi:MAG: hypothetical protein FWG43_05235 [Clostridiales bacterium]|jgi:hypothetical protein|nr:hypothetical protein [Clostridiales bacterium]
MREYEGYYENGQFYPTVQTLGRQRAFLTVLDEPVLDADISRRIAVLNKFFSAIEDCDEEVPDFEKIHLKESFI